MTCQYNRIIVLLIFFFFVSEMQKYGLQLRVKPQQAKKPPRAPLPAPVGFHDDDDEDNVEKEISRQATKNKSLKDVSELCILFSQQNSL